MSSKKRLLSEDEDQVVPLHWTEQGSYSVGHILNDLCAACWFSYLLIYTQKAVGLSPVQAGICMFSGQIADALATPAVGVLSDATKASESCLALRLGRRKLWNLGGGLLVMLCYACVFMVHLGCDVNSALRTAYYAIMASLFNVGWAANQVSHMALVPDLAEERGMQVRLNSMRYAGTVASNVLVFVTATLLLRTGGDEADEDPRVYRHLAIVVECVGVTCSLVFLLGTPEWGHEDDDEGDPASGNNGLAKALMDGNEGARYGVTDSPSTDTGGGDTESVADSVVPFGEMKGFQSGSIVDSAGVGGGGGFGRGDDEEKHRGGFYSESSSVAGSVNAGDDDDGDLDIEEGKRDRFAGALHDRAPDAVLTAVGGGGDGPSRLALDSSRAASSDGKGTSLRSASATSAKSGKSSSSGGLRRRKSSGRVKKTWSCWFKEPTFYTVGATYMCTRLVVNTSQTYIPFYVTETMQLDAASIATVPLLVYVAGFLSAALMQWANAKLGRGWTYSLSAGLSAGAATMMLALPGQHAWIAYVLALLLGAGNAGMMVTSVSQEAALVGDNVESGAFVYGALSLLDKLSCGIVVLALQILQQQQSEAALPHFFRLAVSTVPLAAAVVGVVFCFVSEAQPRLKRHV